MILSNISNKGLTMASRTCPHCKFQYSIGAHYQNTLFSSSYKRWNCSNCGKEITINMDRRMLLAACGGILMVTISRLFDPCGHSTFTILTLLLSAIPAFLSVFVFDKYAKLDD